MRFLGKRGTPLTIRQFSQAGIERDVLWQTGNGFPGLALMDLLARDAQATPQTSSSRPPATTEAPAVKAARVIFNLNEFAYAD